MLSFLVKKDPIPSGDEIDMIQARYGIDVPQQLTDLAERHKLHLDELITMLRTVGMDEKSIEDAVDELIGDYRVQLLAAAKALRGVS